MKYFELGGRCITGPVSLLSGYVSHRLSFSLLLNAPLHISPQHRPLARTLSHPFLRRRILLHLGPVRAPTDQSMHGLFQGDSRRCLAPHRRVS